MKCSICKRETNDIYHTWLHNQWKEIAKQYVNGDILRGELKCKK